MVSRNAFFPPIHDIKLFNGYHRPSAARRSRQRKRDLAALIGESAPRTNEAVSRLRDLNDTAIELTNRVRQLHIRGSVVIAALVAANGISPTAQGVDVLSECCAAQTEAPFQLGAGYRIVTPRVHSPDVTQDYFFHFCSFSGTLFRKRAQKKKDRYPSRKNGPCVMLNCYATYSSTMLGSASRECSRVNWRSFLAIYAVSLRLRMYPCCSSISSAKASRSTQPEESISSGIPWPCKHFAA